MPHKDKKDVASDLRKIYNSDTEELAQENLNKQIRKATKNKLSFEKENRLLDYIFVVIPITINKLT